VGTIIELYLTVLHFPAVYDVTLPVHHKRFWLAHGPHAGSHPGSVNRYHNLGTTMTVETKSPATQINNDQLLPDEENEEDGEIRLTPSPGMLRARPPLFMWSLIADLKRKPRSGKRGKNRKRKRRNRPTLHGSDCPNCSQAGNIRREKSSNTGMSESRLAVHTRPRGF